MAKVLSNIIFNGIAVFILLISPVSQAEDIELYISEGVSTSQNRPKVLLIFDNSGSMDTEEEFKPPYDPDPDTDYDALDGLTRLSEEYIYYATGDSAENQPIPDSPTETRRFLASINGCHTAQLSLALYGVYTGKIREYTYQGNSGRWRDIPELSGESIQLIDCEDDVISEDNVNAKMKPSAIATSVVDLPDPQTGYPVDGEGTEADPEYYTPLVADSNVSWTGGQVTLFTANYLRWQQNDNIALIDRERIDVAKESVISLINSTPGVDFGMMVFNRNVDSDHSGGRIVHDIQEATLASKNRLVEIMEDEVGADTNTPLCETLYEASLYFGGLPIQWGNNDRAGSNGYNNLPLRDEDAEDGNSYESPFDACSDKIYVVYLTDGTPWEDEDANSLVLTRPGTDQTAITTNDNFLYRTRTRNGNTTNYYSYLPAIAGWMHDNDVNLNIDGDQTVSTYTIGFSEGAEAAESLLEETARRGGGSYTHASDSAELTRAFTTVLADLDSGNQSLTSASVASNNFDRAQTLDFVYYAMFSPDRGPRWNGNLKKYRVVDGVQEGANNVEALNAATGHFSNDVQSFWSDDVDGDVVSEGGVAEEIRSMTDRTILSNIGAGNALVALTTSTASASTNSEAFNSQEDLATELGVLNNTTDITAALDWITGHDVDDDDNDENVTEMRLDVFGDPLHSKPVVIQYSNDETYIFVGTNHGILHMFQDNGATVEEVTAFMPKEFISNIKDLRDNYTTEPKVYGADGAIADHIIDHNGNGIVDGDDTVWLFFGFRRGGSNYYALDVTDPTAPTVMWIIEGGTGDFAQLAESWSKPKIVYSKLNVSGGVARPTLIFGGGYHINKDDDGPGDEDGAGNAIYMVDAEDGTHLWDLAPGGETEFAGTDSIPSSIGTLDSDSDGLIDRLYAGDTGGNIWRVDMPGANSDDFSVFRLASLGGDASNLVDRRFFSEPAIVRTYITETISAVNRTGDTVIVEQEIPYDAILIGTGDRTDPVGTDTQDAFYMIKDENIITQQFTSETTPPMPTAPIGVDDLTDYSTNPVGVDSTPAESVGISAQNGWRIDFSIAGEKSTAKALVINNVVYFTTFTPPSSGAVSALSCNVASGSGWLYAVDLASGINRFDWSTNNNDNNDNDENADDAQPGGGLDDDRKVVISEQFLDAPTLFYNKQLDGDGNIIDTGGIIIGREVKEVPFNPETIRTYLFATEN